MAEEKKIRIALAGNPNSGKTTLFNALTGMNQYVGNWPGVTVEYKEGQLKKYGNVTVTDLPGIYSLSPYSPEEVVARNYLLENAPDAILNIIDGTNLERNLYLTTQLLELGIPVVVAINLMDIVRKNGDKIDIEALGRKLNCRFVEISALTGEGVMEAAEAAIEAAGRPRQIPPHIFSGPVEHTLAHIEEAALHDMPSDKQRWFSIKIFERDEKVNEKLRLPESKLEHIETDIVAAENELGDDAETIIVNERYDFIAEILKGTYIKKNAGGMTVSDKIDRIVTGRWTGLPILALVMFLVYYISMITIGQAATDWANDALFGDGFHLFGRGAAKYEADSCEYSKAIIALTHFAQEKGATRVLEQLDADEPDVGQLMIAATAFASTVGKDEKVTYELEDEETLAVEKVEVTGEDLAKAVTYLNGRKFAEPDPADYGTWIPGIPVLVEKLLDWMKCSDWLKALVLDGIVAGVGAVLGFVPQMLVLFLLLAFLEDCGYMARIAFVLDRLFRKFGLSGKSFIPILVGTGCGVPGIMSSRTIGNESDRRMTIITTTFIPCSAKTPFIAMIAGAIFGGSPWIATSTYFLGVAAILISGLMLKKTKLFAGEITPFVMELPAYHWPLAGNVLHSMWERGWSFIKRAGTIILLSTVIVWFTSFFGWVDGHFQMLGEEQLEMSILARVGNVFAWIFAPLGWGNWQATVASVTGLVAKENIVGTLGILYSNGEASSVYGNLALAFSTTAGLSFLIFNLLCCPCFAAIAAMKREMNSARWFAFAIAYQLCFAYVVSFVVYHFGNLICGNAHPAGVVAAVICVMCIVYMAFVKKPYKEKP